MSTLYNCMLIMMLVVLLDVCVGTLNVDQTADTPTVSRLPRQTRLCPHGMSRETCFYSQLNMFMKIHDSMTDPVSLRNIGKRNGVQDAASSSEKFVSIVPPSSYQAMFAPDDDGDAFPISDSSDSILYKIDKATGDLEANGRDRLNLLKVLQDNKRRLINTDLKGVYHTDDDGSEGEVTKRGYEHFLPPQKKRHIICPASMSRIECYDQAMAFYMRLLRSVGKQ